MTEEIWQQLIEFWKEWTNYKLPSRLGRQTSKIVLCIISLSKNKTVK